jgi:Coenzyme PQQ synthesis protein D (PqqD)
MSTELTINLSQVVHETIDGETILIHMGSGTYYSLDGVGAEVWGLLVAGISGDEILARMRSRYDADQELVERTVGALLDELVGEALLTPGEPDAAPLAQPGDAAGEADGGTKPSTAGPFVAPVLHKYTDMQEFMLVDPLHDVEADVGWPHVKAG